MLRQMQDAITSGNLHVKGHPVSKSMFPVNLESEKANVELFCLCFVE